VTPPRWLEDEVDEVTGAGSTASVSSGRGGGWRALLADVLGEPGSSTSALLAALSDPSAPSDRWCDATLDVAWRLAHAGERPTADPRTVPTASLGEVG
jgi:hypothetical protein